MKDCWLKNIDKHYKSSLSPKTILNIAGLLISIAHNNAEKNVRRILKELRYGSLDETISENKES